MTTGADVLAYLRPNGGWVIYGDEFDSIIYDEGIIPITKKEFEEGFAKAEEAKTKKSTELAAAKAALLEKLGITEEEAKLLLS